MTDATICVFAKPPRAGTVKTRLIPALGPDGAAAVAAALLEDVLYAAQQVARATVVISASEEFEIPGRNVPVWRQPNGDLGSRIEFTVRRALDTSRLALALGADTPGLMPEMIQNALRRLETSNAVLGPTSDGGYYLLGVSQCPVGLFQGIRWSSQKTLNDTQRRLKECALDFVVEPEWFDVDTKEDLLRVRTLMQAGVYVGANLATVLRSLRELDRA